ncbi:hypothetical protein GCM10010307_74520 [Streptomyces vastus]|uniref:Membrane transport protein MMPL domain-containing protein n=1 Tax=Streptomyces vastus TaxID=285451 RepID=A0ABN3RQZ6_9ACTN
MPGAEVKSTSTTERRAYDALADGFGPGFNGPLTFVVDADEADDPKAAVTTISEQVGATKGVVSVSPAQFNPAGDTAVFSAVPGTGPSDEATKDLVQSLRDGRPGVEAATNGASFQVTGTTAVNIDVAQKVQDALIAYLVVVVGLAIVLLLVVFRSILVPLKAAVGFLLSVLAALGAVVAVFQWGWGAELLGVTERGPIMSLMPIFLVGIVFGLAMDYEVFLVSRMREAYVHGDRPAQAVVSGFRYSARVVVAAALITIAVFSGGRPPSGPGRTPRRADRPRTRGDGPGRRGQVERGDRRRPFPQPADRPHPRAARHDEARCPRPRPTGRHRLPVRPRTPCLRRLSGWVRCRVRVHCGYSRPRGGAA